MNSLGLLTFDKINRIALAVFSCLRQIFNLYHIRNAVNIIFCWPPPPPKNSHNSFSNCYLVEQAVLPSRHFFLSNSFEFIFIFRAVSDVIALRQTTAHALPRFSISSWRNQFYRFCSPCQLHVVVRDVRSGWGHRVYAIQLCAVGWAPDDGSATTRTA